MFDPEFIESIRAASGDEAAARLIAANQQENHRTTVGQIIADPLSAEKYPRMVKGLKEGLVEVPVLADKAAVETWIAAQEKTLGLLVGTPEPAQPVTPDPAQPVTPAYGQRQNVIPWNPQATQAMSAMSPITPGPAPGELQVAASRVEDLMEVEAGQFPTGRARNRALIKELEGANSLQGGSSAMFDVSRRYESPDQFPV
jgi:hypothetical protein